MKNNDLGWAHGSYCGEEKCVTFWDLNERYSLHMAVTDVEHREHSF